MLARHVVCPIRTVRTPSPRVLGRFFSKFHGLFAVLLPIPALDLTQNHLSHVRFCRPALDFSGLAQLQVRTKRCSVVFGEN